MDRVHNKTWEQNVPTQVVLDSIFAALAAIWLSLEFSSGKPNLWVVICSLISFLSFAVSAEGTATAFDECDVEKFIYYLFWYNFGVISLGIAIMVMIGCYYDCPTVHLLKTAIPQFPVAALRILEVVIYLSLSLLLFWRWLYDLWFIPCRNAEGYNRYVWELTDQLRPREEHSCWMRIIMWRRLRDKDAP